MNITQITVSYGETQSLPEYSNVKPNITLTATLDEGDDAIAIEAALWSHAKQAVHEQIDLALEANDKAAKYDPAPRFQVVRTYWHEWSHRGETRPPQYVVILPNEVKLEKGAYSQELAHFGPGEARKLRYAAALRAAAEVVSQDGYILLDLADGDLTPLNLALSVPERNLEHVSAPESDF